MRLSIGLPNFGTWLAPSPWSRLIDVAVAADTAGIDRLVVVDHVVMGPNTDSYRWGRFPTGPDGDWLEPLTVLSAIAGATRRIRLATGIMIPALRGAAVFAKTTATLDVISQGRLELGVSTGWQREEYDAVGLDWTKRGRLLDDTLGACEVLWRDAPATFESPSVSFDGIWCRPEPTRPEGVPILVAGALSAPNLARLVRWGQGWIPIMGATPGEIDDGVTTIRRCLAEAGRDPDELHVQRPLPIERDAGGRPDLAATLRGAERFGEGAHWWAHLPLQVFCASVAEASDFFDEVVELSG